MHRFVFVIKNYSMKALQIHHFIITTNIEKQKKYIVLIFVENEKVIEAQPLEIYSHIIDFNNIWQYHFTQQFSLN